MWWIEAGGMSPSYWISTQSWSCFVFFSRMWSRWVGLQGMNSPFHFTCVSWVTMPCLGTVILTSSTQECSSYLGFEGKEIKQLQLWWSDNRRRSFQTIMRHEGKPARGSLPLVPTWLPPILPLWETLYFSRDVLKLFSPEGILVAKTGGAHSCHPFGMATPVQEQAQVRSAHT